MFTDGLWLNGKRYILAAVDDGIYARSGTTGVAIAKSKKAIVIGTHGKNVTAGNARSAVAALVGYFEITGY